MTPLVRPRRTQFLNAVCFVLNRWFPLVLTRSRGNMLLKALMVCSDMELLTTSRLQELLGKLLPLPLALLVVRRLAGVAPPVLPPRILVFLLSSVDALGIKTRLFSVMINMIV